ncbi:MAG TPA: hypothetical protein P5530_03710 [Candidatus Diapherotrites archaeon]|nr:hypothetical protein [Candidatus Diapherotrites archaeon]
MAKRKYGTRKDAISKTIVESLKSQENKKDEAINRLRAQLVKPKKGGKK